MPVQGIICAGRIDAPIHWFDEEPAFQFLADPFGWQQDDRLHVFAEHYDYRTRHGTIETLVFDLAMHLLDRRLCLREDWHLSYPQVFAADGAMWMLPEAHKSGGLTLYRDHGDLTDWRPECRIRLDGVPVDATILRLADRWWLFYSPATSKATKLSHLHVAWADELTGPWTCHRQNPVRTDYRSSRPGGTPAIINGRIMLPVQDCATTYGGAVRPLWIDRLDEGSFAAEMGDALALPTGAYHDGMHTLSACGDMTLIDVKRVDASVAGLALDLRRMLGEYRAG